MNHPLDVTNQKFNHLTAIKRVKNRGRVTFWLFECDCQNKTKKEISLNHVKSNKIKSCGCLRINNGNHKTHGESKTRLYGIWLGMKARCYQKSHIAYSRYGRKGIKVYTDWLKYENFKKWSLSNGYKDNLTIDRINNNKGYFPKNCRWATYKEQARHKTNNNNLTFNGKTQPITAWAEELELDRRKLNWRINNGWTPKEALSIMKFKGLDNKEYSVTYTEKIKNSCSKYHLDARNLIKSIFPMDKIFEETHLPGSNTNTHKSLYADFFVISKSLMFEIQGEQHYSYVKHWHKNKPAFYQAQSRDRSKKEWCEINGITLIILPYNESIEQWTERINNRGPLNSELKND